MKIGLNVGERFVVSTLIPKEGNFLTLKMIRELKRKVGFSADDLKKFEIEPDKEGNRMNWNTKGNKPVVFEFKDKEIELLVELEAQLRDARNFTYDISTRDLLQTLMFID